MPASIYARSPADGPLRQGEILTGVVQAVMTLESIGTDEPEVHEIDHPIAIIASQDCDLEQDFRQRNEGKQGQLPSILLYEVTEAQALTSRLSGSDIKKRVVSNKDERYHVLQAVPKEHDTLEEGLGGLGIDFKRYFTIPTDELYKREKLRAVRRRCILTSPYLEHFATRCAAFQYRVALPADHQIPTSPGTSKQKASEISVLDSARKEPT